MRLFIGIGLDALTRASIESALRSAAGEAPPALRLLPADNWHFTLQFLGAVADADVDAVRHACAAAAAACAPFEIALGSSGAFTSPHAARVLWIGIERGTEHVAALHEALLARTEALAFTRDARTFSAHLTIARAKDPLDARAWLATLRLPAQRMAVSTLTLFRSHLSSHGAHYEALEHFPLGSTPSISVERESSEP